MDTFATLSTGARLSFVQRGPSDGIPVVFLHGVTDSWRSFEHVLPLLPSDVRAFAISQRGHGDSSRPPSGYLIDHMAEDLRAFMDAADLPQAVVVGHSMGASVAQRFAADHPERVTAMVLIGAFDSFKDPDLAAFIEQSILPLTDPITAAFAREWQLSTLAQSMNAAHLDTVVAETLKVPSGVWHAAFRGFLETDDFTADLARVMAPTLLLWGDRDAYTNRAGQERLRAALPNARLIEYEGAGHALHWEEPERFVRDLTSFLSSLTKSTPQRHGVGA